jgi:integrase
VKNFEQYAVNQAKIPTLEDDAQIERLLLGYRQFLEGEMIAGRVAPSTVNARVVYLTPFFRWAWKSRHISEMPRCLDEVCKKYSHTPQSKPLPLTAIHKLWKQADGRMKTFIALGLNAGMYAVEIATLRGKHIKGGYVARHRNKTNVPYKIKLWPLTEKLIKKHRDGKGAEDFLFLTKQGHPLVHDGPESKSNALAQAFAKLTEELGIEASWSQFRDTSATFVEKIATTGRGEVDKGLVSMFLAHADTRTARFYVEVNPETIPTAKLDKVIDKLEGIYGLVEKDAEKGSSEQKLEVTA